MIWRSLSLNILRVLHVRRVLIEMEQGLTSHSTKIGHFGDVLRSQSLCSVLKKN